MSKLGIHVSSGDRRGFGDLLKNCANARSPVPVIFSVDQDVWPDVQQYSPQTKVIYRHKPSSAGGDAPGDTYHGDAAKSAHEWMNLCMVNWAKNKADYYAPINEQDAGNIEGYKWLNTFSLECMKIAEANGYRLALYAFSSGNPRDGATDLDRTTLEDKWGVLVPSLQTAKANGHILLLHEYGFNYGTLQKSAPNLALRYRRSLHYLGRFNADPMLVISEASAGVGGYSSIGLDAWLNDAKWYDSELMKDRNVIGCCLYQAGGAENIKDAFPGLAKYISQTPTSAVPLSSDDPVVFDPSVYVIPPPTLPTTYPTGGLEPVPTGPIDIPTLPIPTNPIDTYARKEKKGDFGPETITSPQPVTNLNSKEEGAEQTGTAGDITAKSGTSASLESKTTEIGSTFALNDRPRGEDKLGFTDFAKAFAALLTNPATDPPLTIGIYGSWGMGKSFLLDKIRESLKKDKPADAPEFVYVDFNAWVYSGSENLWAGLITRIYADIERYVGKSRVAAFRLSKKERRKFRLLPLRVILSSLPATLLLVISNWDQLSKLWSDVLGVSSAVALIIGLVNAFKVTYNLVSKTLTERAQQFKQAAAQPNFREKIGYMADIKDEIDFVVHLLKEQNQGKPIRVAIFIDDLDRCPPAKAVEVL